MLFSKPFIFAFKNTCLFFSAFGNQFSVGASRKPCPKLVWQHLESIRIDGKHVCRKTSMRTYEHNDFCMYVYVCIWNISILIYKLCVHIIYSQKIHAYVWYHTYHTTPHHTIPCHAIPYHTCIPYIPTYLHTYIHTCIHTYMHTYIHT